MSTTILNELWHPFWKWEEVANNMWGDVVDQKAWLEKAIAFTGDHVLYGSWMLRVAEGWKYSCEHNLTKLDTNRKAWIGHAAVAMAIQCPEDIVRQAWGFLTRRQQDLANAQAQIAIEHWEQRNAISQQVSFL